MSETTQRIGADELARLVEITTETTRRTAEMPAVQIDELLCVDQPPPVATSLDELTFEDLGDLLREELAEIHDSPLTWIEPPTERDGKRLRIVFDATAGAFG